MSKQYGQNQTRWLEVKRNQVKTYPWLGEVGEPPAESLLQKLYECPETGFNSNCFNEGVCVFPESAKCPMKERV